MTFYFRGGFIVQLGGIGPVLGHSGGFILAFARRAVWALFIAFLTSGVTGFTLDAHVTVQFLPSLSQKTKAFAGGWTALLVKIQT